MIDLGAGSGLLTNKIAPLLHSVVAVEKFPEFSKFIKRSRNVEVINADLRGFKTSRSFDIALLTGVAQCFPKDEAKNIYKNTYQMLKADGVMLARTHCGLDGDVLIDGFSKELDTDYFAEYRYVHSEVELIRSAGFSTVEYFDIYPDSLNVWDNTRHFFFVCNK